MPSGSSRRAARSSSCSTRTAASSRRAAARARRSRASSRACRFPSELARTGGRTPLEVPVPGRRADGDARSTSSRPGRPRGLRGAARRLHGRRLARAPDAARAAAGPARVGAAPGRRPARAHRPGAPRGRPDPRADRRRALPQRARDAAARSSSLGSIRALPVLEAVVAELAAERRARGRASCASTARRRSCCRCASACCR